MPAPLLTLARPLAVLAVVAALASCGGSDGGSGAAATPSPAPAGSTVPAETGGQGAEATTTSGDDTQVIDLTDVTTALPADACALLTPDEVATVLTGPQAGVGAGGGSAPAITCSWDDASGMTTLELTIFDSMGEDLSGIDPTQLLRQSLDSTAVASMAPVDIGLGGLAGPNGDDAEVEWVSPKGLFTLRLWAVGNAVRPGQAWDQVGGPLTALAEAVASRAGG